MNSCYFSDPLFKPFAVLLNYNVIIGQPSQTVNLTSSSFVAYLDNSTSMPKQNSCTASRNVLF